MAGAMGGLNFNMPMGGQITPEWFNQLQAETNQRGRYIAMKDEQSKAMLAATFAREKDPYKS